MSEHRGLEEQSRKCERLRHVLQHGYGLIAFVLFLLYVLFLFLLLYVAFLFSLFFVSFLLFLLPPLPFPPSPSSTAFTSTDTRLVHHHLSDDKAAWQVSRRCRWRAQTRNRLPSVLHPVLPPHLASHCTPFRILYLASPGQLHTPSDPRIHVYNEHSPCPRTSPDISYHSRT